MMSDTLPATVYIIDEIRIQTHTIERDRLRAGFNFMKRPSLSDLAVPWEAGHHPMSTDMPYSTSVPAINLLPTNVTGDELYIVDLTESTVADTIFGTIYNNSKQVQSCTNNYRHELIHSSEATRNLELENKQIKYENIKLKNIIKKLHTYINGE